MKYFTVFTRITGNSRYTRGQQVIVIRDRITPQEYIILGDVRAQAFPISADGGQFLKYPYERVATE